MIFFNFIRFSCSCHKCNIAVRWAIKKCPPLVKILAKLSKYAGTVKNSINLYKMHISKKARLRIENDTRWSSSFLMLEAFQKAYLRNALPVDKPCPISLKTIECYMQILSPAFKFSLLMQKTSSTIADVVPNVLIMLSKWNRMEVVGNYRKLCDLLIKAFNHKFEFELNSEIYSVASLFNVSKLNCWLERKDCEAFRKLAFDNIVSVAVSFLEKNPNQIDLDLSTHTVVIHIQ